jgi:serine/threonine protein kinase
MTIFINNKTPDIAMKPALAASDEKQACLEALLTSDLGLTDIQPAADGGNAWGFIGYDGNQPRFIKVARQVPHSKHAEVNRAKGSTLQREHQVSKKIAHPANSNLLQAFGYYTLTTTVPTTAVRQAFGRKIEDIQPDLHVLVQEYFPSTTVANTQRISAQQAASFTTQLSKAVQHMHNSGLFHRDISAYNVLLGKEEFNGQLRLADLGLARSIDDCTLSVDSTFGKHESADPLLISAFTGKENKFKANSDIYSMSTVIYQMLTGEVYGSFDENIGIAQINGTSILAQDGKIDFKKAKITLDHTLNTVLVGDNEKFKPLLRKGLTLDENQRYTSVQEFTQAASKIAEHFNPTDSKFAHVSKNALICV